MPGVGEWRRERGKAIRGGIAAISDRVKVDDSKGNDSWSARGKAPSLPGCGPTGGRGGRGGN